MNNKSITKLSVIIAFILCLPLFAWTGSGTYEDPYEINTASDVADLVSAVNGGASQSGVYFLQTADIDLSTFGNFTPIGLASAPFAGNYDGDGYILSNLTITASVSGATTNAFGLFGYCENATIENVSVYGRINVLADYNANACVGVGGVVGLSIRGLFASLHNYCDIDVRVSNATTTGNNSGNIKYGVGGVVGLIGWTPSGATYIGCENYGDIYADGLNGDCCVGGCFTANVSNLTSSTFSGFNNYGKIVAVGNNSSTPSLVCLASGIGSFHNSANKNVNMTACSNFGEIVATNFVGEAGICINGLSYNESHITSSYCTNHADIVKIAASAGNSGVRTFTAGICSSANNYADSPCRNCVNFGTIKVSGNAVEIFQCGGIYAGVYGAYATWGFSYGNKNFGDIYADCPNSASVVVGGVASTERKLMLGDSENYGNIIVNTSGSVLIGGVASHSTQAYSSDIIRNCVNFGSITANGNSNTNYSPCVGGVFASTRIVGSNTRNITISNCYNIGVMKLNLNADGCYGAIYGVANTYGTYGVSIKNCYAIVGEGQNLIGAVDASNGNVSLENCVGIKSGLNGGIAYSVVGSNNWSQVGTTLVSYDDCYTNPYQCYGNMGSGIFTPADKTTNYFDLILPINTQLYPTPSAEDKKNHSYTKAQGYKRYVKTNRL